jgi:quercetin dioxygenase-like cupin family protein
MPSDHTAHIVDPSTAETIEVLGPAIQFLTSPDDGDGAPCVMRGTIPPGVIVPLHSHADAETFLTLSGGLEGLSDAAGGPTRIRIRPGDVFHVPGGARHAFRNTGQEPAVMHVVSTAKIGAFFREVAMADGGPADVLERFLETAERYGYWNATPEENAAVGLALPGRRASRP